MFEMGGRILRLVPSGPGVGNHDLASNSGPGRRLERLASSIGRRIVASENPNLH